MEFMARPADATRRPRLDFHDRDVRDDQLADERLFRDLVRLPVDPVCVLPGRQGLEQPGVGGCLCSPTPPMTSAMPRRSRTEGICIRTTAPTMVAVAGSSASISAKVARGRRDIANWSET